MGFYNNEKYTFTVRYELKLLMQFILVLVFRSLNSNIDGPSCRAV